MDHHKEETVAFDTFNDSTPVVLRNKPNNHNNNIQRSKKCFSVIVEPSNISNNKRNNMNKNHNNHNENNLRQSMFELGSDGWTFDNIRKGSVKNILNLDREIDVILDANDSADVVLGSIKLTF